MTTSQQGSQTQFQYCNMSEQLEQIWIQDRRESITLINAKRRDQIALYKWTFIHSRLYPHRS